MMTARGIRNHNPGNIRKGIAWDGLIEDQVDPSFCIFKGPEWGIRAICRILMTYDKRYNINTVYGIINRWAPSIENDTRSYVDNVCHWTGYKIDEKLDITDTKVLVNLAKSITRQENGSVYYIDEIYETAANMALG